MADIGVMALCKRAVPSLELHVSTQAGVANFVTAAELFHMGASRVVLARELSLDEIARIRAEGVDREIFTLCKNEKYGQLIENLENVEDSASQMADFALSGQTVAQQIAMLAGLTAEDADAALQHILSTERMAVMYIQPDGTAPLAEDEEEAE